MFSCMFFLYVMYVLPVQGQYEMPPLYFINFFIPFGLMQ